MKDKQMEKLIDACYDVMFQKEEEMRELGLLNYGDSSYYIQNPDEYEEDKRICELENEVERLEHRLSNCIELPCIQKRTIYPDINSMKTKEEWYVLFRKKGYGSEIFTIKCGSESSAKKELEELKNG